VTSSTSTDITEANVSDAEFGARFLAYVEERVAYHTAELAKLNELRELWAARLTPQEVHDEQPG